MMTEQLGMVLVLGATMGMFLWGRWRHDVVAMAALLACVVLGYVPDGQAFAGFGHPAVITVAAVLVLGLGLQASGAVDLLAHRLLPAAAGPISSMVALISLAAVLSSFMNNVGALALLMPLAIQLASRHQIPAGQVLMPLAFASILGGMTTLIGTPPNLIVSGFRATQSGGAFAMFDFAPVGVSVALAGILFIGLLGWRLVPVRKSSEDAGFDSGAYFSEVRIVQGSKAEGMRLHEVERLLDEADAQIIALVRNQVRIGAPSGQRVLMADDILVIEVQPESLSTALRSLGLKLEEDVPTSPDSQSQDSTVSSEASSAQASQQDPEPKPPSEEKNIPQDALLIQELVVVPHAAMVGRSARDLDLRTRYQVNLLAVSRQGRRSITRLRTTRIQAGDVLLMQGTAEAIAECASQLGGLPLAERAIVVPRKDHVWKASLIMLLAVLSSATGLLSPAIAFVAAALAFVLMRVVPLRSLYTAIDWPVIVLLAAMLPVAEAVASTGLADLIARSLLMAVAEGHASLALLLLLIITMFLSDLMNNAATAALMCPIALSTALQLGANADAFLMAVAVGSSCAFLTPIGHQNNTLILGPGGFHFGDFWRLGLTLEVIVVAVALPVMLWVWPL